MIRNIIVTTAIALCVNVSTASAQLSSDSNSDTVGVINVINNSIDSGTVNTVNTIDTVDVVDDAAADTVTAKAKADVDKKGGIDAINLDDEELLQAALAADSAKIAPSTQKLDLIRRDYEYKRQTRAAIVMMIFIAVAMATSQSWNPR